MILIEDRLTHHHNGAGLFAGTNGKRLSAVFASVMRCSQPAIQLLFQESIGLNGPRVHHGLVFSIDQPGIGSDGVGVLNVILQKLSYVRSLNMLPTQVTAAGYLDGESKAGER